MTRELYTDMDTNGKSRFHLLDPWHTIHLGTGKTWIACGVFLLQHCVDAPTIELRIVEIGRQYVQFCKRSKLDPIIRRIDTHTFGTTTDPIGTWNKAAVTSNFMLFLQSFCEQHADVVQGDQRLRIFVSFLHSFLHIMVICWFGLVFCLCRFHV